MLGNGFKLGFWVDLCYVSKMGFNALKYVEDLRNAGFPDKQAEAQVKILQEVVDSEFATKRDLKELGSATKRDLKELGSTTKRDLKELELELKREISSAKLGIILSMGGILAVFLAIDKLF